MPSELDVAKRALVSLLLRLAGKYGLSLELTRESADKDVQRAYKKVAFKTHPDKGGAQADFQGRISAPGQNFLRVFKGGENGWSDREIPPQNCSAPLSPPRILAG